MKLLPIYEEDLKKLEEHLNVISAHLSPEEIVISRPSREELDRAEIGMGKILQDVREGYGFTVPPVEAPEGTAAR